LFSDLDPGTPEELDGRPSRELRVELDAFTHEVLEQEAAELEITVEEFVRFAALYYLADLDSGRIARHLPSSRPAVADPDPLDELLG
jgi:hypothetical protein